MQKTTLVILFSFFNVFFLKATDKIKPNVADVNFDVTISLTGEAMVQYHDYNALVTYDWQFEYGLAGFKSGEGIVQAVSGLNFYRLNLNPLKKYDFRVRERHLVGNFLQWTDWSQTKTIIASTSNVYSIGYSTDFNDKTKLEWSGLLYNNSTSESGISWTQQTNHSLNNANGASMSLYNRVDSANGYIALISPKFNDLATDRKIKFWLSGLNQYSQLLVGTMTDPGNINTFHLLQEVESNATSPWEQKTVYFNNFKGNDMYIVFLLKNRNSNFSVSNVYIDDISYETASNCYDLSNFSVTNIQENTAQISFDDPNKSALQVSLYNATKRTTEVLTIDKSPFTLTNLPGNTDFEVKVRANCIDDLYSNWTKTISFKTTCTVVSEGYSTSFEGTDYFDLCWNKIESEAFVRKDTEDDPWFFEPKPKTGTKKIIMRTFSGASNNQKSYLITPYVADLDATKRIRFSLLAYNPNDNYNTNTLTIGTMSDPKDASTFIPLKTISSSEMNEIDNPSKLDFWKEHTIYLDNYQKSANHHYIALKQDIAGSSYFSIDDFFYETSPACLEPINPKAINFGYDFATVTWDNYKPAAEWQIEYGPKGFTHGSGIVVNATSNVFKIESLLDDTEYDFYVRAKCGNGYSDWSDKGHYKTKCLGVTAGYMEDFENTVFEQNGCWTRITPYINNRSYAKDNFIKVNVIPTSGSSVHSGLKSMFMLNQLDAPYPPGTGEKTDRVVLVSPRFKDFDHYKKISFWVMTPKETQNLPVELVIGTISDPEDYSTFTTYQVIGIPVSNIGKWIKYEIDFSNYYGTDKFVGIKQSKANARIRRFFIDDFEYFKNSCPVSGLLGARQSGFNSVSLDWKDNNTVKASESWDIEYGSKGFADGTGTIVNVKTNPFNLTGLENGFYEYRVRTYCETNVASEWSSRYGFKISCTKTAPFVENFDQYGPNLEQSSSFCWTYNIPFYAQLLGFNLPNVTSEPYVFTLQTNKDSAILVSPYLEDFDNNKKVKFWLGDQIADPDAKVGSLVIGTIKNPLDLSTFEPYQVISLQEIRDLPKFGKEFNVDFSGYTGANKQIAFKYDTELYDAGFVTNRVLIDNVHYDETLSCYEPIDIVFSNINNNSALLSWTSKNQLPENVKIEYGLSGFLKGSGTVLNTVKNEILVSNLQTGSSYEFYFTTTCNSGNSYVVGPRKIETTCNLLSLPWIEKFNNASAYGDNLLPDCFKLLQGTFRLENSAQREVYSNYSPDYLRNGYDDSSYLYINGGVTKIMTPMFTLNAGTAYRFNLKARNSYEYHTQGVGLFVGRGQNEYNMEANISTTGAGRLTEYNYSDVFYYFTPIVSGDYSFLMDFSNYGGANLIADNFELNEGYKNSINGSSITQYDFSTMPSDELILEGAYGSNITLDSSSKNLVMNGNSISGDWKDNIVDSKTGKTTAISGQSVWEKNLTSISKINAKVNAKNVKSLFMRFDLKQTFITTNNESMFRVVVNGNVLGDIIKPITSNGDVYQNYVFDLTPYVGSDIRISLQHIGKSYAGDNASIDNLIFNQSATLSVVENNYTNFKYYPNPIENILNIESNSILSKVEVYNLNGQLLFENNYSDSKIGVDFRHHPTGVYLIIVTQDDKKETFKVIKK